MSLHFCCQIRMVGSEFAINNMKAWIHPALYQWFRLVAVVSWCGVLSLLTLDVLVPVKHCSNTTDYPGDDVGEKMLRLELPGKDVHRKVKEEVHG